MRTKSFQLEQTIPGSFFFQGLAGGMLAGLISILAFCIWDERPHADWVLPFTPFYMWMGATLGAFKATLLWGAYRITGIQLRVSARVAITTVLALIAFFVGYKTGIDHKLNFAIAVAIAWLTALPVAMLVGSRVKPWEFFTFGSIAMDGYGNRWRSNSLWATFGTLPLRFLSLVGLWYWIVTFACKREIEGVVYELAVLFAIPLIYLLLSAYLSFRSPRKLVLLFIALLINVPLVFAVYVSNTISIPIDAKTFWWAPEVLTVIKYSGAFLITWTVFLAARLSVKTRVARPNFTAVLPRHSSDPDHQCLGSRFVEWQQRVA